MSTMTVDPTAAPTVAPQAFMPATIEKVSIIISKGSLDGVYPGLIMANGARAEGIEANLFFTFFGLDAIHKARHEHIKIATVGNPGLHLSTWLGGVPAGGASGNTLGCVVQESSLKAGRCEGQPIQQRR